MLTHVGARYFKGLRHMDIRPERLNLLIGANGTGKTNFADLIHFISSLAERGLPSALDAMGGLAQVRTRQVGKGRPGQFKIQIELGDDPSRGVKSARYAFSLKQTDKLKVATESLDAQVYRDVRMLTEGGGSPRTMSVVMPLKFERQDADIHEWSGALGPQPTDFDEDELLLYAHGRLGNLRILTNYLRSWRVFNIDAMMAKQSTGGADLELDRQGSNIVTYVARLLNDRSRTQQLLRDLQEAVPYIEGIQPDRILTFKTLRFKERDSGAEFQLPEMSDGTIRLLGLLSVLRQPEPPAVLVMEEPENALHAYAIRSLLRIAREVALAPRFNSQIFFTSHSPAVLDELLSIEARRETGDHTACFVTRRSHAGNTINPAPREVMQGIAQNLGAPSDFQREGSFEDAPAPTSSPAEEDEQ